MFTMHIYSLSTDYYKILSSAEDIIPFDLVFIVMLWLPVALIGFLAIFAMLSFDSPRSKGRLHTFVPAIFGILPFYFAPILGRVDYLYVSLTSLFLTIATYSLISLRLGATYLESQNIKASSTKIARQAFKLMVYHLNKLVVVIYLLFANEIVNAFDGLIFISGMILISTAGIIVAAKRKQ